MNNLLNKIYNFNKINKIILDYNLKLLYNLNEN